MVARITTPASLQETLNYNEHKVKRGVAECIAENNFMLPVSVMNFYNKLEWFESRNALNQRATTKTIHISLNFDPSEKLSYTQLIEIAKDYMNRIGFSDQPYLVYCHHDAGHPHIHILGTTIRADGTRINLHNIGRNLSEPARQAIEENYNLVRARDKNRKQSLSEKPVAEKLVYGKSETKRSIANVLKQVLSLYSYTSLPELNAVLKCYGVMADRGNKDSFTRRKGGLLYRMLDKDGNPKGVPIKASSIAGKPTLAFLEKQFERNKLNRDILKLSLRIAVDKAIQSTPRGIDRLTALLRQQNIDVVLRQNAEGRIYGITFIDHNNRSVFNGSEIGKAYSIAGLQYQITRGLKQAANHRDPSGASSLHVIDSLLTPENELTETPRQLKKKKKKKRNPNL